MNPDELESSIISEDQDSVLLFNLNKSSYVSLYTIKNPALTIGLQYLVNDLITNYNLIEEVSKNSNKRIEHLFLEYNSNSIQVTNVEVSNKDDLLGQVGERALGFLLVFMFVQALAITTLLIKNRENRTYYRLRSSPVTEFQYLAGNLLAAVILLMIQLITSLLVVSRFLNLDILRLIIVLFFFSICIISLGLLITSFSKNRQMASNLGTLVMTPLSMLGGCFWSIQFMPEFLKKTALFIPVVTI